MSKNFRTCLITHRTDNPKNVNTLEKDEIFEGNFRSPRFEKKLGLGLGLKIARAAMRKQGGDVVLSQLANPTIFSIIIPRRLID